MRGGAGNDTITGNGTDRVVADYNGVVNTAITVNLPPASPRTARAAPTAW